MKGHQPFSETCQKKVLRNQCQTSPEMYDPSSTRVSPLQEDTVEVKKEGFVSEFGSFSAVRKL